MSDNTELSKLQYDLLARIKSNLDGLGLPYAIRLPDGGIVGDIDAVRGKKSKTSNGSYTRRRSIHPVGQLKAHIETFVSDLRPGQVAYVPFDKFEPHSVQSLSRNLLKARHPDCTATTTLNREKGCVEVLYELPM